jgi:hypothetical protein
MKHTEKLKSIEIRKTNWVENASIIVLVVWLLVAVYNAWGAK